MTLRSLLLALTLGACSGLGEPTDGTYRGVYVTGFETSSFRPCGGTEAWWLTDQSGTLDARMPPTTQPGLARSAYVRASGRRSARGAYGHLSAYPYEFVVREVLDVVADTTGACQ